jgi:hypothetical protein
MQKMNRPGLLEAFEPGDFLFGLEKQARAYYYDALRLKLITLQAKYQFVTIDDLVKPLEADYIYGNNPSSSPLAKQCSPVRNHGRLLLSSPAFSEVTQRFSSPSTQERNKIIISCLIAIQNQSGKIHFCLDGIDLNKARNNHPSYRQEYNSFTSFELRYIAKHYQDISNKVLFYMSGERVEAPWDAVGQEPAAWLATSPAPQLQAEEPMQGRNALARRLTFIDDTNDNRGEENSEQQRSAKRLKPTTKAPSFDSPLTSSYP